MGVGVGGVLSCHVTCGLVCIGARANAARHEQAPPVQHPARPATAAADRATSQAALARLSQPPWQAAGWQVPGPACLPGWRLS